MVGNAPVRATLACLLEWQVCWGFARWSSTVPTRFCRRCRPSAWLQRRSARPSVITKSSSCPPSGHRCLASQRGPGSESAAGWYSRRSLRTDCDPDGASVFQPVARGIRRIKNWRCPWAPKLGDRSYLNNTASALRQTADADRPYAGDSPADSRRNPGTTRCAPT